jgi:hypothetical protein
LARIILSADIIVLPCHHHHHHHRSIEVITKSVAVSLFTFEVLMSLAMESTIFQDMMPCSLVEGDSACVLLGSLFNLEDIGSIFLRNIGIFYQATPEDITS